MDKQKIVSEVRDQYAGVATGPLSNTSGAVRAIATAFGYSEDELRQLPAEANMGLSCGNPLAMAGIREGEVVVDLGCGGGMDVFLAARKVGTTGRVIGIDMTPEMLDRARIGQQKLGLKNVEFHQATIDKLPLPDNSVDCVISNCVINLVPDKLSVFREILRVLKPGGRLALSDIALKQTLPNAVKQSIEAYVGCIAGAVLIDDYRHQLEQAGFLSVLVTQTGADLNAYALASEGGCCGESSCHSDEKSLHDGLATVMHSFDANAYATSVRVHALKPASANDVNQDPVSNRLPVWQESSAIARRLIQVYDKPMCCSTGVCGPDVDPDLLQFTADLDWLKNQGHHVERYNLAQQPQAFIENETVHKILSNDGIAGLPIVVVDGEIISQAIYPSREELANRTAAPHDGKRPVFLKTVRECCGNNGCC